MATGGEDHAYHNVIQIMMPNQSGCTRACYAREEDRRCKNHEGKVIDERAAYEIDKDDEEKMILG